MLPNPESATPISRYASFPLSGVAGSAPQGAVTIDARFLSSQNVLVFGTASSGGGGYGTVFKWVAPQPY